MLRFLTYWSYVVVTNVDARRQQTNTHTPHRLITNQKMKWLFSSRERMWRWNTRLDQKKKSSVWNRHFPHLKETLNRIKRDFVGSLFKYVCRNKSPHSSCSVPKKNQKGHWRVSIYSNKKSSIASYWDLSQSWIPMSKLRPLHNNFPLTALNEDFVLSITAIMGSSKSTTNSARTSSQDV